MWHECSSELYTSKHKTLPELVALSHTDDSQIPNINSRDFTTKPMLVGWTRHDHDTATSLELEEDGMLRYDDTDSDARTSSTRRICPPAPTKQQGPKTSVRAHSHNRMHLMISRRKIDEEKGPMPTKGSVLDIDPAILTDLDPEPGNLSLTRCAHKVVSYLI